MIKVLAFDSRKGRASIRMSFIVDRPAEEPRFDLLRQEGPGRRLNYTIRGYAANRPQGERYQAVRMQGGGLARPTL